MGVEGEGEEEKERRDLSRLPVYLNQKLHKAPPNPSQFNAAARRAAPPPSAAAGSRDRQEGERKDRDALVECQDNQTILLQDIAQGGGGLTTRLFRRGFRYRFRGTTESKGNSIGIGDGDVEAHPRVDPRRGGFGQSHCGRKLLGSPLQDRRRGSRSELPIEEETAD